MFLKVVAVSCLNFVLYAILYIINISAGNVLGKFKVQQGVLRLAAEIDVDTEPNAYTLSIAVKDRGSPVLTTTVTAEVFVNGLDDNPVVWHTADDGVYDVSEYIKLLFLKIDIRFL